MLKVYCDGSSRGNGYENARGGWAYVVLNDDNEIITQNGGSVFNATNNQMEMTAFINGCKAALESSSEETIIVYMDSAYIHNCYVQKWYENWQRNGWVNAKKEPVKNKKLWMEIIPLFENPRLYFQKVKGHSDNQWNNFVDQNAVAAANNLEV